MEPHSKLLDILPGLKAGDSLPRSDVAWSRPCVASVGSCFRPPLWVDPQAIRACPPLLSPDFHPARPDVVHRANQIGVVLEATFHTPELSLRLPVVRRHTAAAQAGAARVLRRHRHQPTAPPYQLVVQLAAELEPTLIEDGLVQTSLGGHVSVRLFGYPSPPSTAAGRAPSQDKPHPRKEASCAAFCPKSYPPPPESAPEPPIQHPRVLGALASNAGQPTSQLEGLLLKSSWYLFLPSPRNRQAHEPACFPPVVPSAPRCPTTPMAKRWPDITLPASPSGRRPPPAQDRLL